MSYAVINDRATEYARRVAAGKIATMQETIKELELEGANSNTVVICQSKLLVAQNKIDEAIEYFSKNINFFTEESKKIFCERLGSRCV